MKYIKFVLTLAGIVLLQHAGRADSISFTQHLSFSSVPAQGNSFASDYHVTGQYTYGMGWLLGDQFDSGLGQLESMDWSVTLQASTTSHYSYWQPPAVVGDGLANESWATQFIRIGNYASLDGRYLLATANLPLWGENLVVPVSGTANGNLQLAGTVTSHVTDQNLLNDFIQGTSFFVDTKSQYDLNTQYANGGPDAPDLMVDVSYTYNYTPTPVPEPASMMLLALGGVAIAAFRRQRSKS